MRRETGWAGGDARERPVFPARSAGLPRAVPGTGDAAARPRPGPVPVVLPGRRQVLAAHGPARGVAPCPVARAPGAGCCPAGGAGCLPPPRVRGGRIEVIVAWQRARRPGGCAAGISRRPATRARCLAARAWRVPHPPLVRAPSPGRCPRPGSGRDAVPVPAPDDRPAPPCRAAGRGMIPARPSPAPSPPWPGSGGAAPGIPGAAGMAWRDWRWRAASASCGQPLVPTGPQTRFRE